MCKGGGGTNTVTQNSQPPAAVMQQYSNVSNAANQAASNPYYYYPGEMVAGMSPNQQSGIGATSGIAQSLENPANSYGMAQPMINAGAQLTMAGSQPITSSQINQYMNPFLQQAGQTTLAELNQNNAMQQQQLTGNAAASGALGGNRVGQAQAALANQQDLATNATLANINSQGYNTALGAAQTTAGQQLQAGFLLPQTGQLAENASLAGMNAGLTGAGAQLQTGALEQQQQQSNLNASYGQWLGDVQYPFQNTNFLSGVQSGMGSLSGGSSSTSYPGPSTGSQIMGAGLSAAGIYNMLGGSAGIASLFGGASAAGAGTDAAMLAAGTAAMKDGGRIQRESGGRTLDAVRMADGGFSVTPQVEVAGAGNTGYIGPALSIAHGEGPPKAPQAQNQTQQIAGFSSLGDVMKFIAGNQKQSTPSSAPSDTPGQASGGRVHRQSGGVSEIVAPNTEQIMDYEEMGQLYPGSPVRKITYPPPQGTYSLGGQATNDPSWDGRHGMAAGGMSGISGMQLTGQFAPLNATGTLGAESAPGTWGNFAIPTSAPQAGNLAMNTSNQGASYAPVTMPGGSSSGPLTGSAGVPSNYFSSIQAASPHQNWNVPMQPSKDALTPAQAAAGWNAPSAPAATATAAAPATAPSAASSYSEQMSQAIASGMSPSEASAMMMQEIFPGGLAKRGGRIKRQAGGASIGDAESFPIEDIGAGITQQSLGTNQPDPAVGVSFSPVQQSLGSGQPNAPQPIVPRGLRNNNPLNLNYVRGQAGIDPSDPSDGAYGRYVTPEAGVAQATKQLQRDYSRGADTPAKLVQAWSPDASPSVKTAYAKNIGDAAGVDPDKGHLNLGDPKTTSNVVSAMWRQENGQPADPAVVNRGVSAGFGNQTLGNGPQSAQIIPFKPRTAAPGSPAAVQGNPTPAQSNQTLGAPTTGSWWSPYPETTEAAQNANKPAPQIPEPKQSKFEQWASSPWAALADAGFTMMAGTSPFAGVNIGRGMEAGVNYATSMLPQERQFETMRANIAQQNQQAVLRQQSQGIQAGQVQNQVQANGMDAISKLPMGIDQSGKPYVVPPGTSNRIYVPQAATGQAGSDYWPAINQLGLPPQSTQDRLNSLNSIPPVGTLGTAANFYKSQMQSASDTGVYLNWRGQYVLMPRAGAQGAGAQGADSQSVAPAAPSTAGIPYQVTDRMPVETMPDPSGSGQSISFFDYMQKAKQLAGSQNAAVRAQGEQVLNAYGPSKYMPLVTAQTNLANQSSAQNQQIDELESASRAGFTTGTGADWRADMSRFFATARAGGWPVPFTSDADVQKATAAQIIDKTSTFLEGQMGRLASDVGGAQAMSMMSGAIPTKHNTPQALMKITQVYKTLAARQISMAQFVDANVRGEKMDYNTAVRTFNQLTPPEMWASRVDPLPLPKTATELKSGFTYESGGKMATWTGQGWQ